MEKDMTKSLKQIHKQIDALKKKILDLDYVVRGTVYKTSMPCGKPNCICKRDPSKLHGPYWYFNKTVKGKTQGLYLKKHQVNVYKTAKKNHSMLMRLIKKYIKLSEEALEKICEK